MWSLVFRQTAISFDVNHKFVENLGQRQDLVTTGSTTEVIVALEDDLEPIGCISRGVKTFSNRCYVRRWNP
jgi:hypothetical protein